MSSLYIADTYSQVIRRGSSGSTTTWAGTLGTAGYVEGTPGQLSYPQGVAVDSSNNVYVADSSNHVIRKISPIGVVSTFAGSGNGYVDGPGAAARFFLPNALVIDNAGNLYVADGFNYVIRKITPAAVVSTLVGCPPNFGGQSPGAVTGSFPATLSSPKGLALDQTKRLLYISQGNGVVSVPY